MQRARPTLVYLRFTGSPYRSVHRRPRECVVVVYYKVLKKIPPKDFLGSTDLSLPVVIRRHLPPFCNMAVGCLDAYNFSSPLPPEFLISAANSRYFESSFPCCYAKSMARISGMSSEVWSKASQDWSIPDRDGRSGSKRQIPISAWASIRFP